MNKITNIGLLLLSFPVLALCIFVGLDLPIEALKMTGANMPYKQPIFAVCFGLIAILVFRRSVKRWVGVRLLNQHEKFVYNVPISKVRRQRVVLYNLLEAFILLGLCFGTYRVCNEAYLVSCGYGLGVMDAIIFTILGLAKNFWRMGITKKAIIMADRDVRVVYFKGLRKISASQYTIFFDFIKDLHLHMPFNAVEDQKALVDNLKKVIDEEKVYWDESVELKLRIRNDARRPTESNEMIM